MAIVRPDQSSGGGGGGAPSGPAGGDLDGTYPNPTVFQGHLTDQAAPAAPASGTLVLASFNQQGFSVPHVYDAQGNAIEITRDNMFVARNVTGSTIARGSAVYISGTTGAVPQVTPAKADSSATMPAVGLAYDSLANNGYGRILFIGDLERFDTSGFAAGDKLYVSATVAGGLVNAAPATNPQLLGTVLSSGVGNGVIYVHMANSAALTAADTSVVIGGTTSAPTVRTNTLDVIATQHPAAADWSNNSHKITGLANGAAASDALAFGQVFATGALPIADIADPTTGKVIGSSGGQAAAVLPPGYEIGYDQITGNVTVTSTTESSGTTIISAAAHTFDGSPVMAEFFSAVAQEAAEDGLTLIVSLFEGATQIGRLSNFERGSGTHAASFSLAGFLRFTPSAGSHTYTVTAFKSGTNNPLIVAGSGGTGAFVPTFIRFIKV